MKSSSPGFNESEGGLRVKAANARGLRSQAKYVLYWMIAARRSSHNFALDRAVGWARQLGLPLVVLEALRCDYPWASDRLHRFALDGMADNQRAFEDSPIWYFPYVEPEVGAGKGLLEPLAANAAVVVTDEYPCFFLPAMVRAAATRLDVRLETVDGNGILPLAAADRAYTAAVHFRRHMQRQLRGALRELPDAKPLHGLDLPRLSRLPAEILKRWPAATASVLAGKTLAALPIDHSVPPVEMRGGQVEARRRLQAFVATYLSRYHEVHNHPDDEATSRMSPYLHFGHISSHEIFTAVMRHERWSLSKLAAKATGLREGWWGVGAGAEAFLDQLVVWRELGFNNSSFQPDDYDKFETLPEWARKTLAEHEEDPRPYRYTFDQLERGQTHDPLWNAAQREMVRDGWFHNYMRMLWGKKILEWSANGREALETMVTLMNKWSLDGRDPNSYSGYMWTLGKYDRPWPEREIYGTVRTMSSANTAKKVRVKRYLTSRGLLD